MSMLHDNYFNAERVNCSTCGTEIDRGCTFLGECYYCSDKPKQKTIVLTLSHFNQVKRLKALLDRGLTVTGRCMKTDKKGIELKERYRKRIRVIVGLYR